MTVANDPSDLCNCLAMRQAARHVTSLYDRCLAPLGLRVTQYSILRRLAAGAPRGINELAAEMVMDRTTLGRNIRPMERQGWLTIGPHPDDRRARALSITQAGLDLLAPARARWREAQARFETGYGASPAASLRDALRKVVQTAF